MRSKDMASKTITRPPVGEVLEFGRIGLLVDSGRIGRPEARIKDSSRERIICNVTKKICIQN